MGECIVLVSIIVPIYNSENYLYECVTSIINQTYRDLEIILVNDGSTDQSGKICKEFKERDSRIVYIEQENKGEGEARNAGIRICRGDYIEFCDSDDRLLEDSVETLLRYAYNTELVVGGIEKIEHGKLVRHIPSKRCIEGKEAILSSVLYDSYYMNPAICKLYDTRIIREHKLLFNDFTYGADTFFVYKYLHYTKRINFIDKCVYYVNVVNGSMSTGVVRESWKCLEAQYGLIKDMVMPYDNIRHGILMNKIKAVLLLECRISKSSFMNTCSIIKHYIEEEEMTDKYRDGAYNLIIYKLLRKERFLLIYALLRFRIRCGIGI